MLALRAHGPVPPPVQLRVLLKFARDHDWEFEVAWKYSFERIRWNHDTTHRREYKAILGENATDPASEPVKQRAMWRAAYERIPLARPSNLGLLINA